MKKENIRKLNEWVKGKPLTLVIIAQQFAIGAEPCFQFLKLIKSGDRIEAFSSLPKAKEWVVGDSVEQLRVRSYIIINFKFLY